MLLFLSAAFWLQHEVPLSDRYFPASAAPHFFLPPSCHGWLSVLRGEVQGEVCEGGDDGPVPPLLRDVLRGVQVCALGDLRKQGRVPLLPGQGRQ